MIEGRLYPSMEVVVLDVIRIWGLSPNYATNFSEAETIRSLNGNTRE